MSCKWACGLSTGHLNKWYNDTFAVPLSPHPNVETDVQLQAIVDFKKDCDMHPYTKEGFY